MVLLHVVVRALLRRGKLLGRRLDVGVCKWAQDLARRAAGAAAVVKNRNGSSLLLWISNVNLQLVRKVRFRCLRAHVLDVPGKPLN